MAEAAISAAVQILGNLLIEKVKFLGTVHGEVEWLKEELKTMRSFLQDAEAKQGSNESVRNWISQIRDVAHDAKDVMEVFALNVDTRGERCACFPTQISHLDRVGEEIHSIRRRLEAIKASRDTFGIKDLGERVEWSQIPGHVEWHRRLSPMEKDEDAVGLEKDVEELLKKEILDDRRGLRSVTISGMPGIGKSTLARMAYNHDEVVGRFDRRAWVVVSKEFQPSEVFKDLIMQLLEPSEDPAEVLVTLNNLKASKLQEMLYQRLEEKQYFIVLDDVWEDADWGSFKHAFPNIKAVDLASIGHRVGEGTQVGQAVDGTTKQIKAQQRTREIGSRLLLTSRNGISTEYTTCTYNMEILDPDVSWKLFLKKALISKTDHVICPEDLKDVGKEIVEKCGGLPLAINVVAGLLHKQGQSKTKWKKTLEGINFYLGRSGGSIVYDILESSYHNLPPQLKPCFLCLAFFKEDATIRAQKLKNIWIALGFVQPEEKETVEAVARRYLDELIRRNLVQVKDIMTTDEIYNCQVHDLIHELSISKAKEEMNFHILKENNSLPPSDKPRHALYHSGARVIDGENSRSKHLRSLFIYRDAGIGSSSSWKDLELLRLLDMEGCRSLTELPEAIGALIGLRYLGLKNTRIGKLPRSFRKLKNLQIVELPKCILETPNFMWVMKSLRCIIASPVWPELPPDMSIIRSLHTLKYLVLLKESNLKLLAEMSNLCYMGIKMGAAIDESRVFEELCRLENLVRLSLQWGRQYPNMDKLCSLVNVTRLKLEGKMSNLPADFPPNLSHLTLNRNNLQDDPMPVLGKLPCLSYLALNYAYRGRDMVIAGGGFPRIKLLRLRRLDALSNVYFGEGAVPELRQIEIINCLLLSKDSLREQLESSITIDVRKE